MKSTVQTMFVIILLFIFALVCLSAITTKNETADQVTWDMWSGDRIKTDHSGTLILEVQSDDEDFMFIVGDEVLRGKPYAAGYVLSEDQEEITSHELRLVEGDVSVLLRSADGSSFESTLTPSGATILKTMVTCIVLWIFMSFLFCCLVALFVED